MLNMTNAHPEPLASVETLLSELLDGPPREAAYVLNPGDRGLLASLDLLSADAASARPGGRASIAAHLAHLHYGFQLLNRWAQGEDPWPDADWAASWQRQHVSAREWADLRAAFASEARAWQVVLREHRPWDVSAMTVALANTVHLAYHVGAMRQVDHALSGPVA
jgi:hypothetical protein